MAVVFFGFKTKSKDNKSKNKPAGLNQANNFRTELPYDAEIPLRGLYPKDMKSLIRKDTCTLTFIAALFTIVKI